MVFLACLLLSSTGTAIAGDIYTAVATVTLSSNATVVSFQRGSGVTSAVRILSIDIYAEEATTVTITSGGNPASAGTTITPMNQTGSRASAMMIRSDATVVTGALVRNVRVPAGATFPLDFSEPKWEKSQGAKSLEIASGTMSGVFEVTIVYEEN